MGPSLETLFAHHADGALRTDFVKSALQEEAVSCFCYSKKVFALYREPGDTQVWVLTKDKLFEFIIGAGYHRYDVSRLHRLVRISYKEATQGAQTVIGLSLVFEGSEREAGTIETTGADDTENTLLKDFYLALRKRAAL